MVMTLNEIFDTVQYGEKYTKNKILKEELSRCCDKDLDLFYASKRLKELSGRCVLSESEEQKMNRLISKLTVIEDRIEEGKTMSEAYRKMQSTAIANDCEALMEEVTKTRKVDAKKLEIAGKSVAAAKYFVNNYLDDRAVVKESSNPLLNKTINEEKEVIEEVM
jgi:hypothetical protein